MRQRVWVMALVVGLLAVPMVAEAKSDRGHHHTKASHTTVKPYSKEGRVKLHKRHPASETSTTHTLPPGLERGDRMPRGLEKQDKTPAGWRKGRKKGWSDHDKETLAPGGRKGHGDRRH